MVLIEENEKGKEGNDAQVNQVKILVRARVMAFRGEVSLPQSGPFNMRIDLVAGKDKNSGKSRVN